MPGFIICWGMVTKMLFQAFRSLKQIEPRNLMALVVIFTTAANMIKGACQKRKQGGLLQPVCDTSTSILDFWLDQTDVKYIVGAVLLMYVLSTLYDKLR